MHVGRLLQTAVPAFAREDEVFVFRVDLLQAADGFERHEVHAVFVGAEDALCFNGYFHCFLFGIMCL